MGFKPKRGPFSAIPKTSTLNINKAIVTASFIIVSREREREKERIIDQKRRKETDTHTYIHTHTHRERERERERERDMRYSFLFLFLLGFGFGREGSWVVDLKSQVGEIIGFREGQPPNHAQSEPSF